MKMLPTVLCALAAWLLLACGDDDRTPTTPPDGTYEVNGNVVALPREGADVREITIAHEAIPDFVNREGERTGMEAMTMQFEVADGLGLGGIHEGDRVHFTFELRWDARPMLYVTAIHPLSSSPD